MRKSLIAVVLFAAVAALLSSVCVHAHEKGEKVKVLWHGTWYDATVLSTKGDKTCIHYDGYGKNWDECVGPNRVRGGEPSGGTKAAERGLEFRVGDEVKVLWKNSWYDAKVIAVNAKKGKFKITYDGYDKSWDEWVGKDRIKAR